MLGAQFCGEILFAQQSFAPKFQQNWHMTKILKKKNENHQRRRGRVRAKVSGTAGKPRLSVFRSSEHIYAQLIDDEKGITLVSESDLKVKKEKKTKNNKIKKGDIERQGVNPSPDFPSKMIIYLIVKNEAIA